MSIQWPERPLPFTAALGAVYHRLVAGDLDVPCDPEVALAFTDDFAQLLPPEDATAVRRSLEELLAGNPDSRTIATFLCGLGGRAKAMDLTELFFRSDPRSPRRHCGDFIDAVNDDGDGRRRAVFVATLPYFVILRESLYLRRNGWRTYLVSMLDLPSDLKALFERHFDGIVDGCNSGRLVRGIVRQLTPDLFHVQCWMRAYALGGLVLGNRGATPTVCEFYDVTSIYGERDVLAGLWGAEAVDFDLAMERHVLHAADGVVHRFPPAIVERWRARQGAMPPDVEMQAYPCEEFVAYDDDKPSRRDGRIRLVYAGGLVPQDEHHPPSLFPEASQPQTFRSLCEQGFALDVLHNPHRPPQPGDPVFAPFFAIAAEHPHFRLRPGVPIDQLAGATAQADYGLILCDMDLSNVVVGRETMEGGVGTKLFAYLEAGLPVLVNAEYTEMARIVTEHGIGLPVHSREIGTLARTLEGFDYDTATANVRRFNREHGMHREICRLMALYDQITQPATAT